MEEIIEIRSKFHHGSNNNAPYINANYVTIEDMEKLQFLKIPSNQDKPHSHDVPVQITITGLELLVKSTKTENGPQDLTQSKKKETKWWSIRTEYLVFEPEDMGRKFPPKKIWVRKLETHLEI